jgi:hypothetical protein
VHFRFATCVALSGGFVLALQKFIRTIELLHCIRRRLADRIPTDVQVRMQQSRSASVRTPNVLLRRRVIHAKHSASSDDLRVPFHCREG